MISTESPGKIVKWGWVVDTDAGTLRALVFGDKKLADAPVELHGDARLARAFFRLFARP